MGANRGGEVHERIELLQLARACDGQEAGDGDLAVSLRVPNMIFRH